MLPRAVADSHYRKWTSQNVAALGGGIEGAPGVVTMWRSVWYIASRCL